MSGVDIAGLVESARALAGYNGTGANDAIREALRDAADALLAQAAELAEAREESARRLKCMDRRADRIIELGEDCKSLWDQGMRHVAVAVEATRQRDEALAALKAAGERETALQDALKDCIETFELAETPAFVDPHHGVEVEALGVRIGFGALMASASASWRKTLERCGYPSGGEFAVGPCHATVVSALSRARSALENCKAGLADATNNPPSDPGTEQREAGV